MPSAPPSLTELQALAARAVDLLETDGQVTVLWERVRGSSGERDSISASFTAIAEGRTATAATTELDDDHLSRTAKAALLRARQTRATPAPPLPEAAPGRTHDGYDPAVLNWTPPDLDDGLHLEWEAAAARVAIASTRGVRAAEQRSHACVTIIAPTAAGRTVRVRAAAIGPGGLRIPAAVEEARALAFVGAATVAAPDSGPVVLGHEAVATVLDHLRAAFGVHLDLGGGPLAGRFGSRVAAPAINLSDSCRYPGTLPRSYDAEGVPRQPVPLIQDGVAHRRVHDSASAARYGARSTGHATRPAALAPMPEQLVLVGGGADDVAALAAPVAAGLYVPALSPAREADGDTFRHTTIGAVAIRDGELAAPVADVEVVIDPLRVLATVEALTGRQRLVALRADTPGGLGAAVVPALRARDGVRLSA